MHRATCAILMGLASGTAFAACDDGGAASHTPRAAVTVSPLLDDSYGEICVSLVVHDANGVETFSAGASVDAPATPAAARAGGALCGSGDIDVDATCTPGAATATLRLLGIWGADGTRFVAGTDDGDPCGETGCVRAFTCSAAQDVPVPFELTIMPNANQGFFDVEFRVQPPQGAPEMCYAFRLVDGNGTQELAHQNVCSSKYGNDSGGTASYVMPCAAKAGVERNVLTWWVRKPDMANADAWTHPCQAPADAPADMAQWAGGCVVTETCVENRDMAITVGDDGWYLD